MKRDAAGLAGSLSGQNSRNCRSRSDNAKDWQSSASRSRSSPPREGSLAGVDLTFAELVPDAEKLVVLRDAIAARQAARLDLAGVRRDGEIGDERVLRL